MTQLEKIARAIKKSLGDAMEAKPLLGEAASGDWYADGASGSIDLIEVARAAVEAMREPSDELLQTAVLSNEEGVVNADMISGLHRNLIDAILNEKE